LAAASKTEPTSVAINGTIGAGRRKSARSSGGRCGAPSVDDGEFPLHGK
jgi:hypothetical protein